MKIRFASLVLFCWIAIFSTSFFHGEHSEISDTDMFPNLIEMTIPQLQQAYRFGNTTISEVVALYLTRIKAFDQNGPELNSILYLNPNALADAAKLDQEFQMGQIRGPMHGIPVLLKDNIDTYDMPTTAGSRALAGSLPPEDAFIVNQLREAGAVILGKANLSEWANFRGTMSISGWSGLGGQTKNPYDTSRNPCGSSSGSGVAVSANLVMVSIGTETNGSIVCPAHANGIVGIKPTVGLTSRSGIIPISYNMDVAGPMTRTVTDAAILLGVISGIDSADHKTLESEGKSHADYTPFLNKNGLQGKRIGWYTATKGRHYKVDAVMQQTIDDLKNHGAEIIEIDEIGDPEAMSQSLQVMLYEYKAGLNNYFKNLGIESPVPDLDALIAFNKEDEVSLQYFNQHWLEQAQLKGELTETEYLTARNGMHKAMRENGIDKVMDGLHLDAIVAPTGSPAWKTDHINGDHYMMGSSSPAAIAGYPAITVPMGWVDSLPVGISFFGRAWSEPVLIEIAYAYEQATLHRKAPDLN
jgi:amidase